MPSLRCAKRSKFIGCQKVFLSRKAQPWARRTRRRIADCCSAPTRSRAKRCWVHGASGGGGTAAVQLGRARGPRGVGTAGSDEGLKLAREQGAREVFDHRAPDHFEQIMKAAG